MNALGIDVGSSNVKTVIVDDNGGLLGSASLALHTNHRADSVTQDPEALWQAVRGTIVEVTSATPDAARGITTIGVCSQYSSLVPVGPDGNPVGPIVMYMDTRGTELCWKIMERHPEAFETFVARHGIPPIGAGLTLSHLLSLQHDQPEVHSRTATCLEVMDFVNLRLTGRAAATQATMFASQLCDNRRIGATSYDDDLVTMAGIDPTRLPPLLELDGVVGEVLPALADELGLSPGVVVRTAMNDTQAAAFATGVMSRSVGEGHSVGAMIGTTAVIIDSTPDHRVDLDNEVLSMPAPVPGRHLVMAENGLAGRSVEHLFDLMGLDVFDDDSGGGLDEALSRTDPRTSKVLFLPWMSGSMSPSADPAMRGGLLGLSLTTTRDDLVRSAIEGTAFNLGWLLPAVDALTGNAAERIVLAGGAARSSGWAQILADVTGRRVEVPRHCDFAAAIAVGSVASRRSVGADPLDIRPTIVAKHEPDPELSERYLRMGEQFRAAFSQNRVICEALGHD